MTSNKIFLIVAVVLLVLAALAAWPILPVPWLALVLLAAAAYVAAQL